MEPRIVPGFMGTANVAGAPGEMLALVGHRRQL